MEAASVTAATAAVLTSISCAPQFQRAWRDTAGLSAAAWIQNFVLGSLWAFYGLSTGVGALALSEGAFAFGSFLIVGQVVGWTRACVMALLGVAAVALAFVVIGPGPCLVGATGVSLFARVAQIRAMVTSRRASGVSGGAWLLLVASGAAWAATGVLRDDWVLFWSAVGIGVASLAVVAVATIVRRSERPNVITSDVTL